MLVEQLHHAGEIQEGTAEPIHLVDHDAIDLPGLDIGEQALKSGTLHIAAGETAVVVPRRQAGPTLVFLARDIGLGRFPLGIQAVELLFEPFVGGLPRVDGAAGGSVFFRSRLPGG